MPWSDKDLYSYDPVEAAFERKRLFAKKNRPDWCDECGGDGEYPSGQICPVCNGEGLKF